MSATNGLSKTIFQIKLSYGLHELCLLGDLNNEYAGQSSPVSIMNSLFKTIFQVKVLYQFDEVYLQGNLNKWAKASPVLLMHRLFKTTFSLKLLYWLKAMSPGRTVWSSLSRDLNNEHAEPKFPHGHWLTSLFKTTLPLKPAYWLKALSLRRTAQSYVSQRPEH